MARFVCVKARPPYFSLEVPCPPLLPLNQTQYPLLIQWTWKGTGMGFGGVGIRLQWDDCNGMTEMG